MATGAQVPRVDLAAQIDGIRGEIDAAIARVLASGRYLLGPELDSFEAEWAAYCGTRHCVATGSGTDAIRIALQALGVGHGDEVITAAHTFPSTAFAIEATGATPAFVDVDPDTHTMDPARAEAAIGARTRAIVPVHLYGQCADLDALRELAGAHDLLLVEDACQAHGSTYRGVRAGASGDAGCFSFYPTKNLGALGDGGAVVTDDEACAERMRLLRNNGLSGELHEASALNSRLDEIQAAILRVKLRWLDEWNEARRRLARVYSRELAASPVILPTVADSNEHVFHLYVVRAPRRDELLRHLQERGVGAGVHYPAPTHLQPAYAGTPSASCRLPVTEALSGELLSLPMYPELKEERAAEVASLVREFFC